MVRKAIAWIVSVILILLAVTGCWDSKDINEKNISTIVLVDKVEDDYYFYVNIPNIAIQGNQNGDSGNKTEFNVLYGQGKDYVEARVNLDAELDKPIFLGTVRALVFTNNMMRDDIRAYMFRLQSIVEYRKVVYVVSTFDDPKIFLNVQPENNVSVGFAIEDTLNTLKDKGKALAFTTAEVLEWLYSKNSSFVIPNMDVVDKKLKLTGYSVIKDSKEYKGFIDYNESYGLVFLMNKNARINYEVSYGDNNKTATVEVTLKSKRFNPSIKGGISFDVKFEMDSKILYLNDTNELSKKDIEEIKINLEKELHDDLILTVKQMKNEFG